MSNATEMGSAQPEWPPTPWKGSRDELFQKLKEVLMETLAIDDYEVVPKAKLSEHLGAQSIDYLNIMFQLELKFGIRIPRGEILPENLFSNPEFVQNGKMTGKGLSELQSRMPYADLSAFIANPDINKFRDVFTVDLLQRYLETKVELTS